MLFGYGRVSTRDQNLYLQEDALKAAGCEELYMEKITGRKGKRPELDNLRAKLRAGDTVVVWKLSRWGRSNLDLIKLMLELNERKVNFICLGLAMDTRTAEGRMIYGFFSSLAEFEREIIVENTHAGIAAARARGRVGGRPKGLTAKAKGKADTVAILYQSGTMSMRTICKQVGISSATLYRYLDYKNIDYGSKSSIVVT